MLISDWSSDVCSSDLLCRDVRLGIGPKREDWPQGRCSARLSLPRGKAFEDIDGFSDRRDGNPLGLLAAAALALVSSGLDTMPQDRTVFGFGNRQRSEEHKSELQSLMRNSYAVYCLKKKKIGQKTNTHYTQRQHRNNNTIVIQH